MHANQPTWRQQLNLLQSLVVRDLEARNKGAVLGKFWPLVRLLSRLLIYTYIFSLVFRVKPPPVNLSGNGSLTYGVWLFSALIVWIGFTEGLSRGSKAVISQTNLVKKVVFPLELLPLVPVISSFIESMSGLAALIIVTACITGQIQPTIALLPLIWIPQLLLTAGLSYLTSGFTVFIRDIPNSIGVLLNLWFYMTPIVYPDSAIPERFRLAILFLNPYAALCEANRALILTGNITNAWSWLFATFTATLIFLVGIWVYRKIKPSFADIL